LYAIEEHQVQNKLSKKEKKSESLSLSTTKRGNVYWDDGRGQILRDVRRKPDPQSPTGAKLNEKGSGAMEEVSRVERRGCRPTEALP